MVPCVHAQLGQGCALSPSSLAQDQRYASEKEHGLYSSQLQVEKSFSWFEDCKNYCQKADLVFTEQ